MLRYMYMSDFWPLLQGGPEQFHGHLISLKKALSLLENISGNSFADHPDLISAEDEHDVLSFLEDITQELALPNPQRVIPVSRIRDDANSLKLILDDSKLYVLWSLNSFEALRLREIAEKSGITKPINFMATYPYFIPDGTQLILWICLFALSLVIIPHVC